MSIAPKEPSQGFILAEALIALFIIGVVFLALEGSLAIVLRSVAESEHEATAARIAETQRERAFANGCVGTIGVDSANAVIVQWSATAAGRLMRVAQTSRYPRKLGERVEAYDAIGQC